ncbi:MAG: hypothetical protein Q8P33_00905 [bacterium]|nr:hypothetical protein [bacterium]
MAELTPQANNFIRFAAEQSGTDPVSDELPRVQTDKLSSSIARLYEQLRNTVDSTEQHLLRRNAIHRFLRRHILIYRSNAQEFGELLVRELIRAGYIPNNTFPEHDLPKVDQAIQKYRRVCEELQSIKPDAKVSDTWTWGLGLASCEIEQIIYPPVREEALIQYAYDDLKQRIKWEDQAFDPTERDLQLYIALHRAVFKSDARLVEYHLLTSYMEDWDQKGAGEAAQLARHLLQYRGPVRQQLDHAYAGPLASKVRRMTIPYQVLLDTIKKNPDNAPDRFADQKSFINDAVAIIEGQYKQNKRAVRRRTLRSILFIFFTKMLVALALEIPYDLWIADSISYLPLGINVLFHPTLLFALGTFVRFPGKDNTKRILADLWASISSEKRAPSYYVRFLSRRSSATRIVLAALYLITFLVSFGAVLWLLYRLNFSLMAAVLFVFFLSLVTFVGIRLRIRAGEYFMVRKTDTFFGTLLLFLANPLIEIGQWFSLGFRRYNLFLFFFDIVLEAPLKAFTYAIEEWFSFARERSERIIE